MGVFAQCGGTNNATGGFTGLALGYNPSSSGGYSLSGSGLLSTVYQYVGYSGTGTFTQSGGTNNTGSLYFGYNSGSTGSYNLAGSGVLSAAAEYVGNSGTGSVMQSGGTNNVPNGSSDGLYLGYNAGSSGTYNLSGSGVLAAFNEYVGNSGAGTFTQSGGTNSSENLYVANNVGSSGSYYFSGSGQFSAAYQYVGNSGSGTFTQSGGTNSPKYLLLANNAGSSGSYNLSGSGLLSTANEYLGNSGTGTFTQSGGTNTVAANGYPGFCLGCGPGSSGVYNLTGSGLLSTYIEYVGYSGIGTLNQSGGTNNLTNDGGVYIGFNLGAVGSYNLSGSGILTANGITVGCSGTGTFNQSGGTNNLAGSYNGLALGCNPGSSGVYNISGSGLLTACEEDVSCSGTGTFVQIGGWNSVGLLNIGSLGRYQFSGGTLQVNGGLANQGVFDATGSTGVLTATGSEVVDLSQAVLVKTGSMSLSIGPDSLLLLPAGFNPANAFGSYFVDPTSLVHNVGTPLMILPGQILSGQGSAGSVALADFVNCQGTISAGSGTINLNGGVAVSGTGNVNLGGGTLGVNDALSGITGGSLVANVRVHRNGRVYAVRRHEQPGLPVPRHQRGLQRQLHPQRLGTAHGIHGVRGLFRHGHVYPVGRNEYGYRFARARCQRGLQPQWRCVARFRYPSAGVFNLGGGTLAASSAFSTSQAMTLTGSGGNGTIDTGGCQCACSRRVIGRLRPLLARAALVVPWLSGHARGRIGWSRRSDRIGCRHADPDRQRHLLGSHDCQQRSSGRRRIAGQPRYGRQWRQAWRDRQLDERDRQRGRVPGAGRCPGDLEHQRQLDFDGGGGHGL